ncbi:MAG: DUF1080 domain-containing protein [Fibrobacteria bacterium]
MRIVVLICVAALTVRCQASPSSPADMVSDFKYQGEYIGKDDSSGQSLGAQVVAKGNGGFTVAFLLGGLPGMGWDTTSRTEQVGTQQANEVRFQPSDSAKDYTAAVSADGSTISGKTPKGEPFTLSKVVRRSPTLDSLPPPGPNTVILFNGTALSAFVSGSAIMDSGFLLPTGSASSGAVTLKSFGSFTMHLEFQEPFMPTGSEQGRGNSGVYLQGRYELQILDSFGLNILRNGEGPATQECGAFFQQVRPRLNMSYPPLSWQTYDIEFTKAKFDAQGNTQVEPAVVTIRLNGVLIHENQKLINSTLLGDPVTAADGPIRFQAHGDPVRYRNIWIVEANGVSINPIPRKKIAGKSGYLRNDGTMPSITSLTGKRVSGGFSSGVYFFQDIGSRSTLIRQD